MSFSTQPQSFYLDTIQQLLDWSPQTRAYNDFNIAKVQLQTRPPMTGQALLHDCNDYRGGYVSNADLYPQGTSDVDSYNFSFWQYMDNFCYFAHHRISVPTTWWINAAHLNGIPVIGTVIFEGSSGTDLALMVQQQRQSISQLVALCRQYGFDGWFFNIETNLPTDVSYQQITDFLGTLRSELNAVNPAALVIWYDSVTTSGYVDYQNELNAENNPFFEASSGIFTNYWWDQGGFMIRSSAAQAQADQRSPFDVYSGVYVWAQGGPVYYKPGYGNPPNDSVSAAGVCVNNGTSVGLFAPGWTFETATGTGKTHHDNFEQKDTLLWIGSGAGHNPGNSSDCIAQYIAERPVPTANHFATNFDRGCGLMMAVRGSTVSSQQWSNLGLQGLQPTYRFWAVAGDASDFNASFAQDVAYDGGASLLVQGSSTVSAASSVTYRLFDINCACSGEAQFSLVFRPMESAAAYPQPQLVLVCSDGTQYISTQAAVQQGDWWIISGSSAGLGGKTISQIQLQIGPDANQQSVTANYGVYVGLIQVASGQQATTQVSQLAAQAIYSCDTAQGALLTWNDAAIPSRYFDIWQIDGSNNTWLMRVCADTAWIEDLLPLNGSGSFTFAVQAVNSLLDAPALSSAATVNLEFNPLHFDDGPTIALLGNPPITQMTIYAGEILNALQSSNGDYDLPQHGDSSGSVNRITLESGDSIVAVSGNTGVWYGWQCVLQLTLTTRNGKTFGPFGSMAAASAITPFTYQAPDGKSILAFQGALVNVPLAGEPNVNIIQSLNVSIG